MTLRSERSPFEKSAPAGLVSSPEMRHARFKNLTEPEGETSAQSTSSSGGPAKPLLGELHQRHGLIAHLKVELDFRESSTSQIHPSKPFPDLAIW